MKHNLMSYPNKSRFPSICSISLDNVLVDLFAIFMLFVGKSMPESFFSIIV